MRGYGCASAGRIDSARINDVGRKHCLRGEPSVPDAGVSFPGRRASPQHVASAATPSALKKKGGGPRLRYSRSNMRDAGWSENFGGWPRLWDMRRRDKEMSGMEEENVRGEQGMEQ